jgi:hypothetical protein
LRENESEDKENKRDKQRFSSEYTMLSILEYLYMNSSAGPIRNTTLQPRCLELSSKDRTGYQKY